MAERAVAQAKGLANLLRQSLPTAEVMARNAQMERDLVSTGECTALAYPESGEGRRWARVQEAIAVIDEDMETILADLEMLRKAAGFDPKAPLTAVV